jgi:hypothetical protein
MIEQKQSESPRFALIAAAAFCVVVLAAGFFARTPIADAVTGKSVPGISFRFPASYALIAPVSDVFDGLTILSLPQVFAAFGFVCLIAALLRARSTLPHSKNSLPALRVRDQVRFGANVLGVIVAVSGLALVMPRPMSRVATADPDLVTVDFHSHTSASQDARPQFTPDENRNWHRRAGFDVAYVTDHHTFAGADAAARANPRLAGEGTVLLPGLEYIDSDEHVIAIGLDERATNPASRVWHPLYRAPNAGSVAPPPLLILALPGDLGAIPPDEQSGIVTLAAVELSDGSPRGIEQAAGDRQTILRIARERDATLVSGSDNHGWGRTAPAWTVMRIPGWRMMAPERLDSAIRMTLLTRKSSAAIVISRRLPPASSALEIAGTGPALALEILRDIGWSERLSWIGWWCAGWALAFAIARRRSTKRAPHQWSLPELVPPAASESFAGSD